MDLIVGDRVQVIKNINVSFILPENTVINYILLPNEEYTVTGINDFDMLIYLGDGNYSMGAEVKYDDRDKIVKL